ncbi:protein ALTERED XYLOGLUCAN 4-like [Panicum virgatum]|uniref:protein ALTERED XYLOGLUCAN 4-like n=1 Tax=Panicum virgatum TaxID=38727 RepID=UPI0019D636DC|nr:protein ALTERED XYLOGLUCAN 4-like [Panicum virgatum]
MGASTPRHHSSTSSLPRPLLAKRIVTFALYALIPLALLHYLVSLPPPLPPPPHHRRGGPKSPRGPKVAAGAKRTRAAPRCDYSDGAWVRSAAAALYNGTSCGGTIKAGQNCEAHGRPDSGYLRWRWRPRGCALPPFDPADFLRLVRGRHVAFVGDSLARNQCESLVCLLSSAFPAHLVRGAGGGDGDGDGDELRKFRRWAFPSHDATVSVFWSPFLVNGTEKAKGGAAGLDHNRLFLDQPDERWAAEIPGVDVVVLSAGHWFLHPAMFYDRGAVVGCHHCPEPNRTESGFFGAFRLAVRGALREVVLRGARAQQRQRERRPKLAVLTTFSPAHFEGDWDSPAACARTEPYAPGEREVGYMDGEMLRAEAEEAAAAAADARARGAGVTVEALRVTRMAALRADGHPGAYMHPFPFAGGARERVPNDCVHWCLPGPIDTWNEILLQLVKRWADGAGADAEPSSSSP